MYYGALQYNPVGNTEHEVVNLTFGFIGDLSVEYVYGATPTILPQVDVGIWRIKNNDRK